MKSSDIHILNNNSVAKRNDYHQTVERGDEMPDAFQRYKHKFPYFGFVDCKAGDVEFVMFSANDDVVAWEYFWTGTYEDEIVTEWLRMCQGADVILDVGAYTGCMAMIACGVNPACDVYCFEPMPRTVERLAINLKVNGLINRVKVFPVAASDERDEVVMNLPRPVDFLGTGNSIQKKPNVDVIAQCPVRAERIEDCFTLEEGRRISCVKVDVEGHELQALKGMETLIDKHRPECIIEVWPHEKADIEAFMGGYGYKPRQLRGLNWLYSQA
ncbi:FkbM family methyltransferase [Breoghania corrubedonensis]|uniref:FkbM family methyltransferase n=2 Tax=Breoghania corrubedonensis TaxID=665038 RepID=A0A2T5UW73_9HYPH|nr:FkbM family methyltransferase [Breoghania corrubedonensis]